MNELFDEDQFVPKAMATRSGVAETLIISDKSARYDPFPLTDVQKAYWLGRSNAFDLGNIGCHLYLEIDLTSFDRGHLQTVWQMVVDHHDMLRAVICADGTQRILPEVPRYEIEHIDFRSVDRTQAQAELEAVRQRMSHQVFLPDHWPLFELRTSELDRTVLHLSIDLLFVDFWSIQLLVKQCLQLASDPDPYLPPVDISFRDYVLWSVRQIDSAAFRTADAYWRKRLDTLPPAPMLPLAKSPSTVRQPRFVRREVVFDGNSWRELRNRSAKIGVTPSLMLIAAFSRILAKWSHSPHFTLNLTQFQRAPVHPQIHRLIGDFTSVLLLEVHDTGADSFETLARRIGAQFWADLEHREYGGLRVLHDLAKQAGPDRLSMPVVFTSALARLMTGLDAAEDKPPLYSVSQTPQVWLDHQVYEQGGRLYLSWDALEELFPPGLLDGMFAAYCELLRRLAHDDAAWSESNVQWSQQPAANEAAGALPEIAVLPGRAEVRGGGQDDESSILASDIDFGKIEASLLQHPLISQAVVLSEPGRSGNALVGYVARKTADDALGDLSSAPWSASPLISPVTKLAFREVPPRLRDFSRDLEALERRSTAAMIETLRSFGIYHTGGETWTAEQIIERGRLQRRYGGLIARWLRLLALDGLLTANADGSFSDPRLSAPVAGTAPIESNADDPLLMFFDTCRDNLAAMLRGDANPLDLLFPGGDWRVAEALYQNNPLSRHINEQAASAIQELVAGTDGPIRVIELGAGIGSATASLLPILPADRTKYLFTDVTPFFHAEAKQKFAGYPFVEYGVVDALRDPLTQGLLPHSFDLIVAANVMHNAEDPAAALARLRPLLAPGGLILLIEATRNTRAHAVSVGLIEGLTSVAEGPDRPFLPMERWIEALGKSGFGDIATGRDPTDAAIDFGVDLILARAAAPSAPEARHNLERASASLTGPVVRTYLSQRLPATRMPGDIIVLDAMPLTADGDIDRVALSMSRPARRQMSRASNETEMALAEIWTTALGRDVVGVDENFFELGGDSLIAVRIAASVRERFGVELRAQVIFESPRIREMAAEIEHQLRDEAGHAAILPRFPSIVPDPANVQEPFPLTEIQQAYWIGRSGVLELGNVGAHFYLELEMASLDRDRLERAWQQLIERHGMLRTIVLPDGRQRPLNPAPHYRIESQDVVGMSEKDAQRVLDLQRARMSHQVHLGERWPPYEIRMTRIASDKMRLHVSLDLLMIDLWSFRLLMREWWMLYQDAAAKLPVLEISFRDYVLAVAALEATESWKASLWYWQQRIPNLPPAPELPLLRAPATIATPRFKRRAQTLAQDEWHAIKQRAKAEQLTPSSVLLAAFADVLARWSRRAQFTINLTLFQRLPLHQQVHQIVGDFTSITLLAVDCASAQTFAGRARNLQAQLWQDMEHRHVSGIRVIREMARSREAGVRPIMPVVFTSGLAQGMPELEQLERLQQQNLGEVVYSVSQTPQVWLDHQVYEQEGRLYLSWDAVEELFPAELLDDMFTAYCGLLRRLAHDEAAWSERPWDLLPPAQLAQRIAVNDTASPQPTGLLHHRFFEQARLRPHQTAVVTLTQRLSYQEVARRARRLARQLRQMGAQPNRLIAIVMEKSWEQVVAAAAVLEAGAAYLPVDPDLPRERRWLLLDRGEVEIVLTQSCLADQLEWPAGIQCLPVDGERQVPEEGDDEPLVPAACSEDLAYVIFTSGSTGEPKGVMIEHGAALNTVIDINERFKVGPHDRILALSSLSFDLSVYDVFGALAAGATIVMPHPTSAREPADWVSLLMREQVTIWNSVPALLEMLTDHVGETSMLHGSPLRMALLSGDWIPLKLADRTRALIPDIEVVSLGGATEASIWSIFHRIGNVERDWSSIPYGRPLLNQQMRVLNDAMEPCPVWVPGQLYIGGVGLARGYWRDDVRTQAQFVHDPRTGERLYRTGDIGRFLPDGTIEFMGREDDQVKVQGYRIELGEIESTLERHPKVKSAAVVAVGDRAAPKHLAAYVVADAGADELAVDELSEYLRQTLPSYMVPTVWRTLEALPLTSNGKVNRKALPAVATRSGGAPREARKDNDQSTHTLGRVTAMISEELALPALDPHQNLLTVGATSLDLVRIVARLEKEFGVRPSFQEFFAAPTASALADLIQKGGSVPDARNGVLTGSAAAPRRSPDLIIDPAAREAFRRAKHGTRAFATDWGILRLERERPPAEMEAGFGQRRAIRNFRAEPVPLSTIGVWLAELSRANTGNTDKYTYGSAGSCYPVQTYLHAKKEGIAGCPAGTFYYHPVEHGLVPLTLGVELDPSIHEPLTNRPIFEQARFSVFFVNQPRAIEPMYGDLSWRFSVLEAGAMAHVLESSAARFGLGVCPIGMLDFGAVRPLLHLDNEQELLHAHVGGLAEISPASEFWEEGII